MPTPSASRSWEIPTSRRSERTVCAKARPICVRTVGSALLPACRRFIPYCPKRGPQSRNCYGAARQELIKNTSHRPGRTGPFPSLLYKGFYGVVLKLGNFWGEIRQNEVSEASYEDEND